MKGWTGEWKREETEKRRRNFFYIIVMICCVKCKNGRWIIALLECGVKTMLRFCCHSTFTKCCTILAEVGGYGRPTSQTSTALMFDLSLVPNPSTLGPWHPHKWSGGNQEDVLQWQTIQRGTSGQIFGGRNRMSVYLRMTTEWFCSCSRNGRTSSRKWSFSRSCATQILWSIAAATWESTQLGWVCLQKMN